MKESATIALEYTNQTLNIWKLIKIFLKIGYHFQVPEGSTPKDGPSAGVTMVTSLVLPLTQRKLKEL